MDELISRLLALAGGLDPAAGVAEEALAELRRLIVAILIQDDPALVPAAPPPADADPAIAAAIVAGAALAIERNAAGIHSRAVREPCPAPDPGPERVAARFGPFVDGDAGLVQFAVVDVAPLLRLVARGVIFVAEATELPLLLPAGTSGDVALRRFDIPAGTVWIRGERLAHGAPGYAVLRVASGVLELDAAARQAAPGAPLEIALDTGWRLALVPEPPPGSGDGSDGDAIALDLPAELVVRSNGMVAASGAIGMSGFGSALRFDTPRGGAVLADAAIAFPYDALAQPWSIAGNRSVLAGFDGAGTVPLALWALPLTQVAPDTPFEAAHGGSIAVKLDGDLASSLAGASGRLAWLEPHVTANALNLELRARTAGSTVGAGLSLWGPARSDFALGEGAGSLRFASSRDGADAVSLAGGTLRNRWDLPRAADGAPFAFAGRATAFTLIAEPDGLRRTSCVAAQPGEDRVQGVALENLYLQVRPARTIAIVGSGPDAGQIAEGRARLIFDVQSGEPMLPDPYAASWTLPDAVPPAEAALSIALRWQEGAAPAVRARLERSIRFPEPRDLAAESDPQIGGEFHEHLLAQPEFLSLLDLSTRDHHFGIALESFSDRLPHIDAANRLAVELRDVRLLMQPQVHWEPVQVVPDPRAARAESTGNGGRTLVGANSVKLVPVLPGIVGAEIVAVASRTHPAAALFSLPFGLRGMVFMDPVAVPAFEVPAVAVDLHQPAFGDLAAAQQIRLTATGGRPPGRPLPTDRRMPGKLHQTANLTDGKSVLPDDVLTMWSFEDGVPLHAADLSGYGLSCFSDWHVDPAAAVEAFGITQVRFDVLIGRTAHEVIELRSVLAPCQARLVRTIVLERRNSGRVERFDSGWQAVDDGTYSRYVPFETGVVRALRRIRNIRILPQPLLTLADGSAWRPVRFDADADIADVTAGGSGDGRVPALDQAGYVQVLPVRRRSDQPADAPDARRFELLFAAAGGAIGGAIDCRVRLGGTLDMHLGALFADFAPDDTRAAADPARRGFAVAVYGAPTLPRAGQWSAVRIDGKTSDVSTVDPRRGLPVIRRPGRPLTFRDPGDARRSTVAADYGLLFATSASRVLFPRPSVDPAQPGTLTSAPPLMADPIALVQASGTFPRAAFALRAKEAPRFEISAQDAWRLADPGFSFDPPLPGVAAGADWQLDRSFAAGPAFDLLIDSAAAAVPWQVAQPPHDLDLTIDPFGTLLTIGTAFTAESGGLPGMRKPTMTFGPFLDAVKELVNALDAFVNLDFPIEVEVNAGQGPSPSFVVHLHMKLTIGGGPDGRIDIGLGKFYGEFEVDGTLEAAIGGDSHGRLSLVFQGDVQQAIIPPILYAGGLFRFALDVRDTGKPLIELGLGTTTSIGGDLIKGLLAVEATVKYGYMLIPETLQPGVLLGVDARAKLLAGLFALSFSADAMARVERLNHDDKTVRIFADIRVAGSIQVAVFFKKSVDFHTQFEQNLPLTPLLIAANVNPLVAAAASAVI